MSLTSKLLKYINHMEHKIIHKQIHFTEGCLEDQE